MSRKKGSWSMGVGGMFGDLQQQLPTTLSVYTGHLPLSLGWPSVTCFDQQYTVKETKERLSSGLLEFRTSKLLSRIASISRLLKCL